MSRRLALQQVVDESMIHIIEPIATQAVKFIVNRLGFREMMKDSIFVSSDFKETSATVDKNNNPTLLDNRVMAKLTPSVNPRNNKWEGMKTAIDLGNGNTIIRSQDAKTIKRPWSGHDITGTNYAIFHDDDLYLDITECNVGASLSLEVRMIFHDLSNAQRCLSTIFAKFTNGDMIGYIPIQYDYPIPRDIQNVLRYFYKISDHTQTTAKYAEWIADKSKGCLSTDRNRNDLRNMEMVGLKNGIEAIYMLECGQDAPEPAQPSCYSVNFTLTVQYSRCNQLVIDYPIIANNQLVDANYVPMNPQLRIANKGPVQWQNSAVDDYWHQQYQNNYAKPIMYPWWDRWVMPGDSIVGMKGFHPVFVAAITLEEPENPKGTTVLDIKEGLPGYKLSDKLLELLNTAKSKALWTSDTYVNIAVFAHDYQVEPGKTYRITTDTTYQANKDYYTYNSTTKEYKLVDTRNLIGSAVAANTYDYTSLLEFDGRYLTLKSRNKTPIYRMVISINPKPINRPEINWVWLTTIIVKREGI